MQHCADMQLHMPDVWRGLVEHRRAERNACRTANADSLIDYIAQGYNPENLIASKLENATMKLLTEYGDCLERSGSLWAFAGYALHP
jgi:hypothetical protein